MPNALNAQVVFNTIIDANIFILAAVIGPFVVGVWWQKANRTGALASSGAANDNSALFEEFVRWRNSRQ